MSTPALELNNRNI